MTGLLPPLTAEEYRWLAELFKPEEEYYKVYSDKPHAPPKGVFLLMREPYSRQLKVCYPSGDWQMFNYTRHIITELVRTGLPKGKIERALDYVWNFGKVYVKSDNPELYAPVLRMVE